MMTDDLNETTDPMTDDVGGRRRGTGYLEFVRDENAEIDNEIDEIERRLARRWLADDLARWEALGVEVDAVLTTSNRWAVTSNGWWDVVPALAISALRRAREATKEATG